MSTMTAPVTLDVSGTPRVPLSRLIKVELRKMTDTRAGMWLMVTIAAVTVIATTIFGLAGHDEDRTFYNFMQFAGAPQGFLLPVLGILLVTQEWSQRTGMVTFTLEPHRARVLSAKVYAALLIGVAAFVIAVGVAALATVLFGGTDPWRELGGVDFLKFGILQITGLLQGLAFGLLFLNSAFAIVLYFVLPTVFSILFNTVPALQDSAPWIDFGTAQGPLGEVGNLSGKEWAQLGLTATWWVILPFVAGLWRVLRAEVK
ncbi:MAG: ABC transporter permease [Nocardioidaceae bacterium]|nr:ABC transporter permease [Nocardioidaceae bacterium]